ncbi:MAG TPA: hypothetical protein VHS57_10585 [Acidimicrobiales bacterium]|nr:hypothetical protein [Acidimicrobiales bacterium]
MNEKQKRVLIVVLIVHVILLNLTWRDLRRRPASAVRGKKRIWRLWSGMNTTGSVAYWLFGRRRVPGAEIVEVVETPA